MKGWKNRPALSAFKKRVRRKFDDETDLNFLILSAPDAVEQEETPFNDPPILVPEPLSVRPPLVSADARENEPDAGKTGTS